YADDIVPAIVMLFKPNSEEEEQNSLRLLLLRLLCSFTGEEESINIKPLDLGGYYDENAALILIIEELVTKVLKNPFVPEGYKLTKELVDSEKFAEVEGGEAWEVMKLLLENGCVENKSIPSFLEVSMEDYTTLMDIAVAIGWEAL